MLGVHNFLFLMKNEDLSGLIFMHCGVVDVLFAMTIVLA